jgi:hypothetical protein
MKPEPKYTGRSSAFWAHVKYISEKANYTERGKTLSCPHCKSVGRAKKLRGPGTRGVYECKECGKPFSAKLRTYDAAVAIAALRDRNLMPDNDLLAEVIGYLNWRANAINTNVAPKFMDRAQAASEFDMMRARVRPTKPLPMNKQKGDKRHPAYLASLVAMIAENVLGPDGFVDDARKLSILTWQDKLVEIFSRRFDGALPDTENPRAVWEIKEYYGTTTFGSRVADGVYETLLDGYEIEGVRTRHGRNISHFLFIDDRFTWWDCGKSYLCRMIDMLHTGHVDEIFFGREVLTDWRPRLLALKKG